MNVLFEHHLAQLKHLMQVALDRGQTKFELNPELLMKQLAAIHRRHQRDVIWVAVSDGMREVSPEKKLSTWEAWPYWYPVEQTFVNLAERKKRDKISQFIWEKMGKRSRREIDELVDRQAKGYLRAVRLIFGRVATDFFKDPDSRTDKDVIRESLKEIFKTSNSHAEMIFRTETTRYFNDARIDYFKENTEVDFMQLIAITDSRVSDICESRDFYVLPIGKSGDRKFKPPFHPNCRTVLSPLISSVKSHLKEIERNLGDEFGRIHSDTSNKDFTGRRRASSVQIPKGWG